MHSTSRYTVTPTDTVGKSLLFDVYKNAQYDLVGVQNFLSRCKVNVDMQGKC